MTNKTITVWELLENWDNYENFDFVLGVNCITAKYEDGTIQASTYKWREHGLKSSYPVRFKPDEEFCSCEVELVPTPYGAIND